MSQRILVVDDDHLMASTLCDILEHKGWLAEPAHSGEAALDRAATDRPDVVLMDIKMGGMNGVEALKALRALHPTLRVILMTAYSVSNLLDEARRAGAVDVLSKPLDPNRVLALLDSLDEESGGILVVDDNPEFLESLAGVLADGGRDVREAAGLDEALEQLETRKAAVVLLDMVLPGVDPEDCVMAIKRASPAAMFVLYSGYPKVLDRTYRKIPASWVCGCLHKPFEMADLLEMLDVCTGD
jgi:CheY-like chemotaxis protein